MTLRLQSGCFADVETENIDKNFVNIYNIKVEVNTVNEIERLQKHLLLVRRTVGWTAEEFGDRIGVTRQTINNLEAGRNKLTKTQYIAMRSVLDVEISQYLEEMEMLRLILDVFIDNPDKYSDSQKEELLNKANMLTPSILAGTASRQDVSKELISSAMEILGATVIASMGMVMADVAREWLVKAIFDKKK